MPAKLLTDRFAANAKPKRDAAGKLTRAEYSDAASPGLRLIIQPTGSRSWALRYRRPDGRTAKATFPGSLSLTAARAAASTARLSLERGADPAPQRLRVTAYPSTGDSEAIEVVAAQFLALHSKKIRPKTLEQYESILRNRILPAWHGRSIANIKRRDAIDLVESIAADYPVLANRTVSTGSKFFAWMVARDMIDANVFTGVERPHVETPRKNVIPEVDLRALWIAGGELGAIGAALKVLILTGCRLQEVSRMTWDELDLEESAVGNPWQPHQKPPRPHRAVERPGSGDPASHATPLRVRIQLRRQEGCSRMGCLEGAHQRESRHRCGQLEAARSSAHMRIGDAEARHTCRGSRARPQPRIWIIQGHRWDVPDRRPAG